MIQESTRKAYLKLLAQSFLEEQRDMMEDILDYTPELDTNIDQLGLESGEWAYDDREWRFEDGTTFDPIERLLFAPPVSFIKALLKAPFLSLYECLFLVGKINGNFGAVADAVDIAYMVLTKKIVSPRDPKTSLKLIDIPSIRFSSKAKAPDLSWLLSFEEAEAWSVNSFGLSLKEYRDKLDVEMDKPLDEPEAGNKEQDSNHDESVLPGVKPAYLDENHPMFSRELSIAIEAWEQVLSNSPPKPKTGSRKNLILNWLEEYHKNLPVSAKVRIAVMS